MVSPQLLTLSIPARPEAGLAHRVSYRLWGQETAARTVVCVHGLTRNAHDFDFLAQALAHDYRVLCLDMPGRGASEWLADPACYAYPFYVADCLHIVNALGLTQIDWIGTSMGGIIGMMLANAAPGLLRSLTLNDIGCLVPAGGLRRIMSYVGVDTHFNSRAAAEATLRGTLRPFGLETEREWQHLLTHSIQDVPDGTARLAYDPAIAHYLPKNEAIADVDLWALWPAIAAMPVLLIHGVQSDILTDETARNMQLQHPNLTRYEVGQTGHAPALLANGQIDFIKNWLNGV